MVFIPGVILALAVLAASPGDPVPPAALSLRPELIVVARTLEILDGNEHWAKLDSPAVWLGKDVDVLRQRRLDLVDAPPADDAHRFPGWSACSQAMTLNSAHQEWLTAALAWQPWKEELSDQATENRQLRAVWDATMDCQSVFLYVSARRLRLKRLREILGERDYFLGRLPPPIPIWRLEVIR